MRYKMRLYLVVGNFKSECYSVRFFIEIIVTAFKLIFYFYLKYKLLIIKYLAFYVWCALLKIFYLFRKHIFL
jgi:hypothetical protein